MGIPVLQALRNMKSKAIGTPVKTATILGMIHNSFIFWFMFGILAQGILTDQDLRAFPEAGPSPFEGESRYRNWLPAVPSAAAAATIPTRWELTASSLNQSPETLGSYRDCPGRRGRVEPVLSARGSFDRIV